MNCKTVGILIVLCVGCSARPARSVLVDVSAEVARADRLWQERGVHGLDEVVRALEFDDDERGAHPDVMWRKVRAWTAKGQASAGSEDALEYYGKAREEGLACLEGAPSFRLRKAEWGWVDAVQFIPSRRAPCAAMLGVAWVRWFGEMGPVAASSDLEVLDVLLGWSQQQPQLVAKAYGRWGAALLAGMRAKDDGRDVTASREGFESAMAHGILPAVLIEADQVRWACPDMTDAHCEAIRLRLELGEPTAPDVMAGRRAALDHASRRVHDEP